MIAFSPTKNGLWKSMGTLSCIPKLWRNISRCFARITSNSLNRLKTNEMHCFRCQELRSSCCPNGFSISHSHWVFESHLGSFSKVLGLFSGLPFSPSDCPAEESVTKLRYHGVISGTNVLKWGNNCHQIVFRWNCPNVFLNWGLVCVPS